MHQIEVLNNELNQNNNLEDIHAVFFKLVAQMRIFFHAGFEIECTKKFYYVAHTDYYVVIVKLCGTSGL